MKFISNIMNRQKNMSYNDFKKYIISETKKLEDYYQNVVKFNIKKYDKFSRYIDKNIISSSFKKLLSLQNEVDALYGFEGCKYERYSYLINKYDYKYDTNFYEKIKKIKWEEDINVRYKLLKQLYNEYRMFFVYVSEKKLENKKTRKLFSDFLYFIKEKKNLTKKEIDRNKKITKQNSIKIGNKEKLLEEDTTYEYIVLNDYSVNTLDLNSVLLSYKHLIKREKIDSNLLSYLSVILKRMMDEKYTNEEFDLLYGISDSIKYRKRLLDDNELSEKKILSLCNSSIKKFIELEKKIEVDEEKHDYRFDLVLELLNDKNNYSIMNKLVNEYPQIVNVRKDKRSILVYLLSLYTNNYKMIIKDHEYDYNIDYLKEVYILFSNSKGLYLSEDDKEMLNVIIDEFINSLDEVEISSKRKNRIINELKGLYPESVIKDNKYNKKVDKYEFDMNIKDISFYDFNNTKRCNEADLTEEKTFMLNNPFVCYSFNEEKGVKTLKIHTSDFSNIVLEGSALDNYIYNCALDNKKIKEELLNYLRFKEGEKVSAFTYEITFDDNLITKNLKIYRSRIKVDGDIINYSDNKYTYMNLRRLSNNYIKDHQDNSYTGLCKIEFIINRILQDEYYKLAKANNLPIIAYKEKKKEGLDPNTFSCIKNIFYKLPQSDYKKISRILSSEIEEKYYDSFINKDENCNLFLEGIPCYMYLMNQRMIKELLLIEQGQVLNDYSTYKSRVSDKYENIKNILNDILNYKFHEAFDYKKRRNFKKYVFKN